MAFSGRISCDAEKSEGRDLVLTARRSHVGRTELPFFFRIPCREIYNMGMVSRPVL